MLNSRLGAREARDLAGWYQRVDGFWPGFDLGWFCGIMSVVRRDKGRAIHVGVNAHLLSLADTYRSAGINWYIQNLLNHLPEVDPHFDYTVFLGERRYPGGSGLNLRFSRLPTQRPQARIFWEQAIQPWSVRKAGLDLIHGTAFVGPQVSTCPFVVTVHDLSFISYPQNFPALNRAYLRTFTQLSVRRARRVIAVSESTKRDLMRYYDVSGDRVDVVYNGVDPSFRPMPAADVAEFRRQRELPDRFILFVGTLEPRKNVTRLIEAYARLPRSRPPLMLLGGKGWLYDEVFGCVETLELRGEVSFVGYVPVEELPLWYNAASLFVYPSLYEGFGLPPLEAMACGTPVVASDASSLPEVVGQAGLLADPTSSEALAQAIQQVLESPVLQEEMGAAGLVRAKGFSWRRTADCTVASYRRALKLGKDMGRPCNGGGSRV
jgi:glycosyltransferase involved in cell wall biosynthesis